MVKQMNVSWVAVPRGRKWVEHSGTSSESDPDNDRSIGAGLL